MSKCHICGATIGVQEPRDHREAVGTGLQVVVHRACAKEGVERWNRDGRPCGGPLEAARKRQWSWPGSGPDAAMTVKDYAESYTVENHPQPDRLDDE